jgi:hypothetical protein
MKLNVGFDVCCKVDVIALSEIQYNVNCLRNLQCVIVWSVFVFFMCMLEEFENVVYTHHQFACVSFAKVIAQSN